VNPILKNRGVFIAYIILFFILAALYSVLLGRGTEMDAGCTALDAFIYGLAYGLQGLIIWNLLRYSVPRNEKGYNRFWCVILGIMTVITVVGLECLVMWACLNEGFVRFAPTIPSRIFVTALVYIILLLYYTGRTDREKEEQQPVRAIRKAQPGDMERITIKTGGKIKVIVLDEINYLQAEGDYVAIVTAEGRWLKEQTMKYFDEHLPPDMFVRIHRSYIVGVPKIARIERYGNLYQVVLRNGEKIKVSATGYRVLKEKLDL